MFILDLVAINYRNLIRASDIIMSMDRNASSMTSSVHDLPLSLTKLIEYQNSSLLATQTVEDEEEEESFPAIVVIDAYYNINNYLDSILPLKAATHFIACNLLMSVYDKDEDILLLNEKKLNINKSLIRASYSSLKQFQSRIISLSLNNLRFY